MEQVVWEKYVGNNVYNRTSFKLKAQRVINPPDMWIRSNGAFQAAVDETLFARVQAIIKARSRRYSDSELLAALNALLHRHGMLSGLLIDEQEAMPSSSAYRSRFGTLLRAYQLVGYSPRRDYQYVAVNRTLRQLHPEVVSHVIDEVRKVGGSVLCDPDTDLLAVNEEFTASVVIIRPFGGTDGADGT
jgi:hypothetical protein